MSNKVQDIGKRNHAHCFLDNISNIKNFDPNNIKKDEKSNKILYLLHWICEDQRFKICKNQ